MTPLRTALSLARGRLSALALASALLRLFERLALVIATYAFVSANRGDAAVVVAALAALFALRAVVSAVTRAEAQQRLHRAAIDALLRGDVLRGSVLPDEDAQMAVFEGIHHGGRILYETVPDLAGDAVAAVALGVLLVATKPLRLLLIGALAVGLAAVGVVIARRITAHASERAWKQYKPVVDAVIAGIGGRLELVASGREDEFVARFEGEMRAWRRVSARSEGLSALAGRAPIAAAVIGVGLALLLDQSLRGALTSAALGDAALFASVVPTFTGLARSAHELAKGAAKFAPMAKLLGEGRRPVLTGASSGVPELPARIEWKDVAFAYTMPDGSRGPTAIEHVSIAWEPGHVLVIAGPNGSGKSTSLRLLLALAAPTAGKITVGQTDLTTIDRHAWRRAIAYLPQRPFMPDRVTVRDAIRLFVRDVSDDAMRAALERVEMWNVLVQHAPKAPLEVPVATLSVGQRQRVALARLLVQDARILLLDEPDANLDAAGIALVARIVRSLAAERMIAVVAHSEQILAVGDRVVTLGGHVRNAAD